MECFLKMVLEVLSQIAAPCIKAFREGGEKARGLQARAETAEKERLEWKERCLVAESQNRALQEQHAKDRAKDGARITLVTFALVWSLIFPHTRVLVGLFVLGVVCGSYLPPLAESLEHYANEMSRQIPAFVNRLLQGIRSRVRDWRWKSAPVSANASTSQ